MENTKKIVEAPKTVSADAKIQFTCDAVIKFENDIKSSRRTIDIFTGKGIRVLPKGSIQELKLGTQNYYDRALLAESKCKTTLYGGLAGGAAIGACLMGLGILMHKRIKRQHKESK